MTDSIPNILQLTLPEYDHVLKLRNSFIEKIDSILWEIEKEIVKGRDVGWTDEDGIKKYAQIYLTKARVKSTESIFLKSKRNPQKGLEGITDYAGLRVLVMFEDQLLPVLEFLLKRIIGEGSLVRLVFYNIKGRNHILSSGMLNNHFYKASGKDREDSDRCEDCFSEDQVSEETKESGYQSIHLLFKKEAVFNKQDVEGSPYRNRSFVFEIQVRTLLQDVWAEMEHKLSYKQGKTNPNISNSFLLLKEDLVTLGKRLTNIKELRDAHLAMDRLAVRGSRPFKYFLYENNIDPSQHFDKDDDKKEIDEYHQLCLDFDNNKIPKNEFLARAHAKLERMKKLKLDHQDMDYWLKMEEAYLFFIDKTLENYEKAERIYRTICNNSLYDSYPVPLFRLGELLFNKVSFNDDEPDQDDNELLLESLRFFDKAINIISNKYNNGPTDPIACLNGARVLTKITTIYEMLGFDEYLDYSLSLLIGAADLLKKVPDGNLGKPPPSTSANNLGWILVEKMRLANKSESKKFWLDKCLDQMEILLPVVEEDVRSNAGKVSANTYDTVAWFLFQSHKAVTEHGITSERLNKLNIANLLEKSKEYCEYMGKAKNTSIFVESSMRRLRNHAEAIMMERKISP